jgi:hypothetical protein
MTAECCVGGQASRRLAPRLFRGAASILPGAALALLPKCPMCIAAWLTAATGLGFSAAGVSWVRGVLLVLSVAAVAIAAISAVRPRFGADRPTLTVVRPANGELEYPASVAGRRNGCIRG